LQTSANTPGPASTVMPEQELFDATIRFHQNERVSAVLKAGRIRKFEKQANVLLDWGMTIDFFDEEGKHTTRLTADSGRVDELKKDMLAVGNVVAKSDSGEMLETQFLRWDNRTRKIVSDAPVKLSTPTDTLFGTGFVSDEHLRNWNIERPHGRTFRELESRIERTDSVGVAPDSGVTR
jgi:LPS export ABC transporter protein LptC